MIIYEPLVRTLRKKGVSVSELGRILGNRELKCMLNTGDLLSLRTVDRICKILNCKIQDVLEYRDGPQVKNENWIKWYRLDWGKIKKLQGTLTDKDVSVGVGRSKGYIHNLRKCKNVSRNIVDMLANYFKVEKEEIIEKVITKKEDRLTTKGLQSNLPVCKK
jgi:DNA-binding Xre family transcriptional regulator